MKKIENILKEVLIKVNPPKESLDYIEKFLKKFIAELEGKFRKMKADVQIFVGGSFAKGTMIRKGKYDVDVFARFDEKYRGKNISGITKKALEEMKADFSVVHGSRDYFRIDVGSSFFVEIVPVIKVKKPKEAENITDLSYFHVDYVKKKLKTGKMTEEVRLAKAFCHANKCYGAEGYINGFSGYALELLINHYKSFLNFARGMTKIKDKEIIDNEKLYKNKSEIMMNMNSAKMVSPIIVIDPTYKERNALAALSEETFRQFKEVCRKFLKNPSEKAFEEQEINLEKIKENARKTKSEFISLIAETDKQEGDVAGSKLIKFYRHLSEEIGKYYKISNKGFDYNDKKQANYFFVLKKKDFILLNGPDKKDKKNSALFRKKHKNAFVKGNRIFAKEKLDKSIREFINDWKFKNSEKMKEMHIVGLKID
ncbi:CCA-adding enzyme [uncultured archaeon]|nr:CCA-adding enzyme [uncultured archaeon]